MRLLKLFHPTLFKNFQQVWCFLIAWVLFISVAQGQRSNRKRNGRGYAAKTPTILATQTNYTYNQGDLAVLYCTVENLGTKTVVWRKTDKPNPLTVAKFTFVGDSRIQVHHVVHKDQWNLHIRNSSKKDEGVYECQVSTKERSIRRNFLLTINDEVPVIQMTGNLIVEKGGMLQLVCNASGGNQPLDNIDWFKDGNDIVRDDDTRIVEITESYSIAQRTIQSTLRIAKVRMSDAGTYLCRTSGDLVTHQKVHVLNAESFNVKRGTSYELLHSDNGGVSLKVFQSVNFVCILMLSLMVS